MNALIDDLDLQTSPEDDARDFAMAGTLPDGKYHARLIEAADDQAGTYPVVRLKFQVLSKPYAGKVVKEDLFLEGSDAEKTEKAKQRKRMFLHRLGVLKSSEVNGKKQYTLADPNKNHFRDYLGAECIIDVKTEEREFIGKKGDKVKFKENRLQYEGLFKLDDQKVKDVKRGDSSAISTPAGGGKQAEVNLDGI